MWIVALLQTRTEPGPPAPGDTITVLHPPPGLGWFDRLMRWFFSVPQWVQVTGLVVAAIVALVALVVLWRYRRPLMDWVRRRHETTPPKWKVAGAVAALVVLVVFAATGFKFFTYTQNDNQFCVACHTLHDEVYTRFLRSKHHTRGDLTCHDCHREGMLASVVQVVKWISLRPEEVGPHAPVPTRICAECHVQRDPAKNWQQIVATAGHTVHLLSDTARKLEVQCVTCHGVTAHRFQPTSRTCGQDGCHERVEVKLGKMAEQTDMHCAACHRFTAPVRAVTDVPDVVGVAGVPLAPAGAPHADSARAAFSPTHEQCLRCHQMRTQMAEFIPQRDPHLGQCGMCHNAHTQPTPAAAFETCTNAGCHQRADTLSAFHRGLAHAVLNDCGQCHEAHTWHVSGTACLRCHEDILADDR